MRYLLALSAIIVLLLSFGCSDRSTTPTTSVPALHEAQVPPEVLYQLQNQQPILEQAILDQGETQPIEQLWPPTTDSGYAVYAVTILWGQLLGFPMPPFPTTDWSGKLSVSSTDGIIRVACPIDFERGEDSLVPVTDPTYAAWVSKTTGDFDGLSFIVRVRLQSTNIAAPHLNFETTPFSIALPFSQLDHFIAFFPVNNTEGVAVLARRIRMEVCPGGYIKGEWVKDGLPGDSGHMRGMWYDRFGVPVGIMAGAFWTTENGERFFAGTLSGVQLTVVLAEFKGHWMYDDYRMCPMCGEGHGRYRGQFQFANNGPTGLMTGEFGDYMLPWDQLHVPLYGVWKVDCPLADPDPEGTDH